MTDRSGTPLAHANHNMVCIMAHWGLVTRIDPVPHLMCTHTHSSPYLLDVQGPTAK
jgi:hypothetical protein